MICYRRISSPLGPISLSGIGDGAGDTGRLTGLWFDTQKPPVLCPPGSPSDLKVFDDTERWLELYFSGREPGFTPPLCLSGSAFRMSVWKLLLAIPYGQTTTYGALAAALPRPEGSTKKMSAQAVGGAVGHNPVAIIVPCHRVVGASGCLTGYAGGLDIKQKLLACEGVDTSAFFLPKTSRFL